MCKNGHFQSLGTKNEFYVKFRDKNNSLIYKLWYIEKYKDRNEVGIIIELVSSLEL